MKHVICNTTNLGAVKFAERIFDGVAKLDVDNGTIGYLTTLADGYSHVYNFEVGVKEGAKPVLVHMPEWDADECRITNQRLDKFFNPEGVPFRAYVLKETDEFEVSAEAFVGEPEVGKFVTIDATGKLLIGDAEVEGAVMNGEIMRKRTVGATLVTDVRSYGHSCVMYTVKVNSLA